MTLHHDNEDFEADAIAHDIVVGVALTLDQVGGFSRPSMPMPFANAAWMYGGLLAAAEDDWPAAHESLLIAALIARNDPGAWANAVVSAIHERRDRLPLILEAGVYLVGGEFEELVIAHAQRHLRTRRVSLEDGSERRRGRHRAVEIG